MARVCTVCRNENRSAIDAALANNESLRDISGRFHVSKSALERHAGKHLPSTVLAAQDQAEIKRADALLKASNKTAADLLDQAETLQKVAQNILSKAYQGETYGIAIQAIREARECLRLQGELLGELDRRPQIGIVIASPEWQAVRVTILNALTEFPEARQTVVKALGNGHTG